MTGSEQQCGCHQNAQRFHAITFALSVADGIQQETDSRVGVRLTSGGLKEPPSGPGTSFSGLMPWSSPA